MTALAAGAARLTVFEKRIQSLIGLNRNMVQRFSRLLKTETEEAVFGALHFYISMKDSLKTNLGKRIGEIIAKLIFSKTMTASLWKKIFDLNITPCKYENVRAGDSEEAWASADRVIFPTAKKELEKLLHSQSYTIEELANMYEYLRGFFMLKRGYEREGQIDWEREENVLISKAIDILISKAAFILETQTITIDASSARFIKRVASDVFHSWLHCNRNYDYWKNYLGMALSDIGRPYERKNPAFSKLLENIMEKEHEITYGKS